MRAFRLSLDNAILFWEVCQEMGATTEVQRLQILDIFVQLGKVDQVTETPKTKEEYIKHLIKHFKCAIVTDRGDAQQEK